MSLREGGGAFVPPRPAADKVVRSWLVPQLYIRGTVLSLGQCRLAVSFSSADFTLIGIPPETKRSRDDWR